MLEQQRAHHGRQRQRNKTRHHHCACQRQSKLNKQAASAAWGKGQWRVHRRQRDRHGNHSKADFTHPFDRSRERIKPFFNMPINIFQHHNRVVYHQANSQHQRQQRQRVDAKASQRHERKGPDQANRNSDDGNDGRAQRAQKNKNHQRHEYHRFNNRLKHVVNRLGNKH